MSPSHEIENLGALLSLITQERSHERRLTALEHRQDHAERRLDTMDDRISTIRQAVTPETAKSAGGLPLALARLGVSKLTIYLAIVAAALIAANLGMQDLAKALLTVAGRL
jgi:hypothetical protein